jgi:hypothetical protein
LRDRIADAQYEAAFHADEVRLRSGEDCVHGEVECELSGVLPVA